MNDLLKKLNSKNITINLIDNQLDIKAPKGVMTPELLSEIKDHKETLISFMSEYGLVDKNTAVIPIASNKSNYLLSSSQYRLWLLQQIESDTSAYNMPSLFSIKGTINILDLEKAFLKLIEHHEILRTNVLVEVETGTPKQYVKSADTNGFRLNYIDISKSKDISKTLQDIKEKEVEYSFDLESESLLRVSLIKKSDDDYILVSVMHHIISDGWSSSIMIADLFLLYQSITKGDQVPLEPLSIQYKDFAEWQQSNLNSNAIEADKNYWLSRFKEEVPILDIPTYNLRPSIKTYNGKTIEKRFDKNVIQGLKKIGKDQGATLFMGLLAAVKILFHKYTNQSDIVIGSPFTGREHSELQNQIGFYVNTVGLRTSFKKEDTFKTLLDQVRTTTLDANTHQNFPFDELIKNLDIRTDRSRNPLFDVMLTVNSEEESLNRFSSLEDLVVEEIELTNTTSKFDLEFAFREDKRGCNLFLTYNTDIYAEGFISNATAHLEVILKNVIENPDVVVTSISYITEDEETAVIDRFNNTKIEYQCSNKTYIDLFEEQVKRTPNNIAVTLKGEQLTYRELDKVSNQFAHYLIHNYSIELEDFVGVKLERSNWLVVSFLAVLKSGAAYLPIDLDYPEDRISFIESDSQCKMIINDVIISEFQNNKKQPKTLPQVNLKGTNLAYVLYTSGSTGRPKGTLIEHNNLLNLCFWHIDQYNVNESSRGSMYSGIAFDASIWEMSPYLLAGATLYPISDQAARLDLNELKSFLKDNKITHSYIPTSICHELVSSDFTSEEITVLTGGDTLKIKDVPKFKLYNNYGPTENTVVTTSFNLQEEFETSIPIGKPISNTNCYVLNDNLELVPIGILGKLFVSGAGVARGYLNQPELTKEKFIANPFIEGERMYDTGDVAKWLPDGNIEFLGRKDSQVKIRGYRIELEEIENTIAQFSDDIQQVILDIRQTGNEQELVVYYVCKMYIEKSELRNFLEEMLPAYMVPSYYTVLDTIPLTPNGKVDRKALPEITSDSLIQKEYVAPRNEIEKVLIAIWEEVLGVSRIGITDNFFELGGHSLLVGQIINRTYKQLNKTILFKSFFETPSIAELSKKLDSNAYNAIPQAGTQPYYPLTTSQHRIWVLSQLEGGNLAYNMPGVVKLKGDLDVLKFEEAFKVLIKRHEILRTNFKADESGEIHQYIISEDTFEFSFLEKNVTNLSKKEIEQLLQEEHATAFDLAKGLLLRAVVLKTLDNEHIFSLTMHHIIGDGWSLELLISEVISIYNNLLENKEYSLPKLDIQYKDYAVWLQSDLTKEDYKESETYWLSQFQGELPILDVPSFKNRPKIQTYNGKNLIHSFSSSFLEKLKAFSTSKDVTLFMTLMSGINALLYRYSNQNDIIIGTPIAGREHPDLEDQIGLYLNTLAIRTRIKESYSFLELIEDQKETLVSAYEHQNYPFDELVNKLNLKRDTARSALFDVLVVLQNQAQLRSVKTDNTLDGIQVEDYKINRSTSQFDMSFTFVEKDDELELSIDYNTDIYDDFLIERIFVHYERFMNVAINNPQQTLSAISYITEKEEEQLLVEFNDTTIAYPKDKTIVDVLQEQIVKTPENIAIVFENKKLSYKELNEKVNQLARYLLDQYNLETEDLVGVKLDRSEWLIISLLAILKTGAAYVPIDPAYPKERISYIENDSNCKVIIDENELKQYSSIQKQYSKKNLEKINQPNNLAYVIYTSGSTGKPKGVMINHSNTSAMLHWSMREFENTDFDVLYAVTSHCFDLSVYEFFYPLSIGKQIRLLDNGLSIGDYLDNDNKVLINTVPSTIQALLDKNISFSNIVGINLAGEAFPPNLTEHFQNSGITIRNLYGPSEDTTYSSYHRVEQLYGRSVPIGKPLDNTQFYILSEDLALQPVGVVGEICISGDGLSRGYLNQPELTKEKFISNPYVEGERMYGTGDLAKWLPDGNIEFIGRKDSQVKIRGYRIELEEIENTIIQFSDAIQQVVLNIKETRREKELVAYFVCKGDIEKNELRAFLQERLPMYMVPSYYMLLDVLPLTPNGKIDKKGLPEITSEALVQKEYVAPVTEIEKQLAAIWEEVLGVEKISVTDNFFELGGHSLMIGQVINIMQKQLDKSISFKEFFASPSINKISDSLNSFNYSKIPLAGYQENYPLTTAQNRFWVLSQLEGGNLAYNMPSNILLKGLLDVSKFEEAFAQLINRHEILRTCFLPDDSGTIRQYINTSESLNFRIEKKDFLNASKEDIDTYIKDSNSIVFDLEKAPLLRGSLLKLDSQEHLFSLTIHHIVGDGWSMELLISEVVRYYNNSLENKGNILPELTIQYKDYAVWSKDKLDTKEYKTSEKYWLSQFEGEIPVLELPNFKTRPLIQTYKGNTLTYEFSKEFLLKLKRFSEANNATLFMTLMTGINALLYRYTNQKDIVIGTPIAGRDHPDLEGQIGLYLNTLAIRTKIEEEYGFHGVLEEQKVRLLAAYEHQNYPFHELVNKLDLNRDISRSPLFDVMVVLQNQRQLHSITSENTLSGITVSNYEVQRGTSQFDLSFTFIEEGDELELSIDYNTDIYDDFLIERIFVHYERFMNVAINSPQEALSSIKYITEIEEEELLVEFNDTTIAYPKDKTIVDLFEAQVQKTPDHIALVFGEKELSYKHLNEEANQLAHYLRDTYAIVPDNLIGVKLDKSEQAIISILGILKSGAGYVPIDKNYPQERITYIEKDIDSKFIIDDDELYAFTKVKEQYPKGNINKVNAPDDLAYIIYTSGTTGAPKGVMVEHRNVVRLVVPCSFFPLTNDSTLLSTGSISFDATIIEFFGTLLNGSKLVLTEQSNLLADENLGNIIRDNSVDSLWMTASWFNKVVDNTIEIFKPVKQLIVGGDVVSPAHVWKMFEKYPDIRIVNGYGPTENTTFSTTFEIKHQNYASIPIGSPISNSNCYILDDNLEPLPIGASGKLYVSGSGVARGYLNNQELTAERFLVNPFIEGDRMYDTGDMAKWLPDGNIEFLGRKDSQVKIRGYRIELGEIENTIFQFSDAIQQVVLDIKGISEKELVAYYVSKTVIDKSDVRDFLQKRLPSYMIPNYYVALDTIPLTSNGKVDKKGLSEITSDALVQKEYVEPGTEIEKQLVTIWQEVLGVERVGVTDNFFELGGHSLILSQIINRVNKILEKNISFKTFFQNPTIQQFSSALTLEEYQYIPVASEKVSYPVTSSQNRLWILSQFEGGSRAYNISMAIRIRGNVNIETFSNVFEYLIDRHEILRTCLKIDKDKELKQFIIPNERINFSINQYDYSLQEDKETKLKEKFFDLNEYEFDLEVAPLIKVSLIKTEEKEFVFHILMHHSIGDGWSLEVLMAEFIKTYEAMNQGRPVVLPELSIQYKDYTTWLNNELNQDKLLESEKYWLKQFEGEIPVLQIPIFKTRPIIKAYNGNFLNYTYSKQFLERLKYFSNSNGATLFMTLMAGINALFYKYTGQEDIVLGTTSAGRDHIQLENQIGLYLNTLAIRTKFEKGKGFLDLLFKQKNALLNAFEHQQYPFDQLIDKVKPKKDVSRSALFDVIAVLHNQESLHNIDKNQLSDFRVDNIEDFKISTNKFDLNFNFYESEKGLTLDLGYDTDIYDEHFIKRVFEQFENILNSALNNVEQPISQLNYLSDSEKDRLLTKNNNIASETVEDTTIINLFEAQVEKSPCNIAMEYEGEELTYKELNIIANQFAHFLKENYKIESETVICIHLERSDWMIIALLGILKSGAVYAAIDPDYSDKQIEYIIQDTNCKLIISEKEIEMFELVKEKYSIQDLNLNNPNNLASILYKFNTISKPKGIILEHKTIANTILYQQDFFKIQSEERGLQFLSLADENAIWEIFPILTSGSTLYIIYEAYKKNSMLLQEYINEHKITFTAIPFNSLQPLQVSKLETLKTVLLFDTTETSDTVATIFPSGIACKIYTPSGSGMFASILNAENNTSRKNDYLPIGEPISNTEIYVLDEQQNVVTIGVIGEIYVNTSAQRIGYYNKPKLTSETFVKNPFRVNQLLYKTGELGRYLADGSIEYLGLKYNPIEADQYKDKLRKLLIEHDGVEEVFIQIDAGVNNFKSAVYVCSVEQIDDALLYNYLEENLIGYVLPSHFIHIEDMPLLKNGQVDIKKLPDSKNDEININREYIAARNEIEEKLIKIWEEVLEKNRIGIHDNFFELGGNSLKAIQLNKSITIAFPESIQVSHIFSNPTVASIAKLVTPQSNDVNEEIMSKIEF